MSAYTVINLAYAATLFGFAWLVWSITRTRPTRAAEHAPPAPDNQPGTNTAAAAECARIYNLPAYDPAWNAGLERLWDAVRDEQQKGDQP